MSIKTNCVVAGIFSFNSCSCRQNCGISLQNKASMLFKDNGCGATSNKNSNYSLSPSAPSLFEVFNLFQFLLSNYTMHIDDGCQHKSASSAFVTLEQVFNSH